MDFFQKYNLVTTMMKLAIIKKLVAKKVHQSVNKATASSSSCSAPNFMKILYAGVVGQEHMKGFTVWEL
jgi:hypothetical protein